MVENLTYSWTAQQGIFYAYAVTSMVCRIASVN